MTAPLKQDGGYSLIEAAAVIVLMAIIAGLSLQAVISCTELFFTSTRDYLEVCQESRTAIEKIVREIRESNYNKVTFGSQTEIILDKKPGHGTPLDADVDDVRFYLSGDELRRESDAGTYVLADRISSFSASTDDHNVITIDLTAGESVHLRTAVWTRQTEW